MQRGEVYQYLPVLPRPGQSRARLIIRPRRQRRGPPVVLGLQVLDRDPGGLLSIGIGELGWASVLTIEAVLRGRLGDRLYRATQEEMDAVSIALRAAQDL
ncbi:MAG: hypothetical protein M3Z25_08400 [Actinomycetota bacterium]|nr:hypothetical protein [Actinomycetota bacterium]